MPEPITMAIVAGIAKLLGIGPHVASAKAAGTPLFTHVASAKAAASTLGGITFTKLYGNLLDDLYNDVKRRGQRMLCSARRGSACCSRPLPSRQRPGEASG